MKRAMVVLVALLVLFGTSLAQATILFQENFENGTPGSYVVGTNGWTGASFLKYSSTTIDAGQSAGSAYDSSAIDWPRMSKTFTNTIGAGQWLELNAVMNVNAGTNDYMQIELRKAGTSGSVGGLILDLGYWTTNFHLYGLDGNHLVAGTWWPEFPAKIEVWALLKENETNCYYRPYGTETWIQFAGDTCAMPLSEYSQVDVATHNYSGNGSTGNIDSITLQAVPEPASLIMLCLGGLGLLRRKIP